MAAPERLIAALDAVVDRHVGVSDAAPPGAVIHACRGGVVLHERAYGLAQRAAGDGAERPMRPDTVFDLGSVTKIVATTAAIMALVDRGRLDLDAPVSSWLEGWDAADRGRITPRHLLEHRAGLWEWWPTYFHARDGDAAIDFVASLPLRYPIDDRRAYSDLGFMVLGEIVRRVSGQALDAAVRRLVLDPLGMGDTAYRPAADVRVRAAATSAGDTYEREMVATGRPYPVKVDPLAFTDWRDHTLVGEVNDGNAHHAFRGIAGHAGLFSTARDLATFGAALASGGEHGVRRIWDPGTVTLFTHDRRRNGQGLGFWSAWPPADGARDAACFGHGGFPGTRLAVLPASGSVIVLLTNRLHSVGPARTIEPMWLDLLGALTRVFRQERRRL